MASPPPSPLTSPLATSAPDLPKSAPPVPILPSQLARIYSFLHPAALLSVYAARFPALVADPVSEMAQQLPILAVAHVVYAMICLPPAGSDVSLSAPTSPAATASGSATATGTATPTGNVILRPGKVGRRRTRDSAAGGASAWGAKVAPALLSLTLTTLLATPTLAILLILFGAPFTTHHVQTLLCAAHMAILSSTGLIYVHGVDGPVWKEVWGCKRPGDAVWGGALGTAVGAWLGAVPIPLDWDRPWQAYPITLLTGAYLGFVGGTMLGRSVLFGKRVRFDEGEESRNKVD
ncbi:PIG-F family protein [Aspergillus ibericus CBS 121593]|uniref:GPI-anchor biosynthesis protein n=1 Tax=Aspergillus ibericus CBS 121593 TaxID=1448316 RepID=A0A395GKF9_9EURO|nr:hypothetical protein BO80DRAFT_429668 [Aspergillus ibericus CBS 121593]RAK95726.1 hypothetical protein BO80DRAFT_429668 [Aspergillus ibericus CBS 121593]